MKKHGKQNETRLDYEGEGERFEDWCAMGVKERKREEQIERQKIMKDSKAEQVCMLRK